MAKAATPADEAGTPAPRADAVADKTYPRVTKKGDVTITEFGDGTTHYNALGTTK
ncbi:hypothetical protein QSH46_021740 [Xanthomonas arboricola pv. juglandis]|uniref:hypothetical protein n=1 Tax=Xanthomonas arboricola TaxID=56448 RepID=UPI0002FB1643|nr:hypothetical protein [Xanthomonas arboricola]MDN0222717.1 hypothetical protein [Xanthomonas arboricola pv. juglandis]MDN0226960.1 hypothetical protein [Xanthomonas arboricola pv. juglandis]MDN0231233.1 hypothetical protein [Xanthomonas arboricola pv. juglandis]MDN0235496.1 hypothetical protein [Xanthomonas arboricola pv. juglandis]MDN0239729.1 hypothetical protein [Xanthomonas arboricola pv. juglandis]